MLYLNMSKEHINNQLKSINSCAEIRHPFNLTRQPRILFISIDLEAYNLMNHLTSTLIELDVLGMKLQVKEVEELNFHVHFKK